jgi:DNA-binding MarR family transcriptional regulator
MAGRLSDRELAAWRGFLRTHALLWREFEAHLEARHAITFGAYDVLVQLDEAPESRLRMTALADAVLMTSGGFTRLADRLVREGLVARERCIEDGRGFELVLTAAGRLRLDEARETHRADIRERFLAHTDADDQARLAELWARVQDTGSE